MEKGKLTVPWRLILVAVAALAMPLTVTPDAGVAMSSVCGAEAEQGSSTCCKDPNSMCDGNEGWYDTGKCGRCPVPSGTCS